MSTCDNTANNKRIAKNTVFLYFRMLVTIVISLYTSRVFLEVLGIDDYGLYITVGGIVTFMSFINSALASGSSRFITYALGEGDKQKQKITFSTTLSIHIAIGLLIVLIAETIGLWYLYNKMVIPVERLGAAVWVFHLSVVTAFMNITQVPYVATINAHERMNVYAYASIIESVMKLLIVYALTLTDYDKLYVYAMLYFIFSFISLSFYRIYCVRNFEESKYNPRFYDKQLINKIGAFSSWNFLEFGGMALNGQGSVLLLNLFFAPAVVTARSISSQVNGIAVQFVNNFRMAANPQIIKKYASDDIEGFKKLLLSSSKYSYYLMWMISLPLFFLAEPLLHIWLKEVPGYTLGFLRIVLIQNMFSVLVMSFHAGLIAKGKLKENVILTSLVYFIQFPLVYLFFKLGFGPMTLAWVWLVADCVFGFIVKPYLLAKFVDISQRSLWTICCKCIFISLVSFILPFYASFYIDVNTIIGFFLMGSISIISAGTIIGVIGLDKNTKTKLLYFVRQRFIKKNSIL